MENFTPLKTVEKKKKKVNKFLIFGNVFLLLILLLTAGFFLKDKLLGNIPKASQAGEQCCFQQPIDTPDSDGNYGNCGKSPGHSTQCPTNWTCEIYRLPYGDCQPPSGGGGDNNPTSTPIPNSPTCTAWDSIYINNCTLARWSATPRKGACKFTGTDVTLHLKSNGATRMRFANAPDQATSCNDLADNKFIDPQNYATVANWTLASSTGVRKVCARFLNPAGTAQCGALITSAIVGPTDTPTPTETPFISSTPTSTPIPIISNTPTPTLTPVISNTPTNTPTSTPGPSATPIPVLCGTKSCDNATNPCRSGYDCVQANDGSNYCSSPDFVTACKANPSYNSCCTAPGAPTATPTEIILAKVSPTVVKLLQTGISKSFMYWIPAAIMMLGFIL